jgi:hypothetical protein
MFFVGPRYFRWSQAGKSEARNPKEIRNPKAETTTLACNLLSRLPCRNAAGQPARLKGHRSSNGDYALRISVFGFRFSPGASLPAQNLEELFFVRFPSGRVEVGRYVFTSEAIGQRR